MIHSKNTKSLVLLILAFAVFAIHDDRFTDMVHMLTPAIEILWSVTSPENES